MGTEHTEEGRSQSTQDDAPGAVSAGTGSADTPLPPHVALGLWMSWMETNFGKAQDWTDSVKPWWQVTPDDSPATCWPPEAGSSTRSWRATHCCARLTRCGTPIRYATSCRWTGRRSPARSAPSG